MKIALFALILILFLTPCPVQALATYSGSDVVVTEEVHDDLFASGGSVTINAPVDSAIIAGGSISINAPIKGDLIAAGGTINLNSDVGGKIVLAGGTINVNGRVGTNAVIAGGEIHISPETTIARDAVISGGSVTYDGTVNGTLTVKANSFENRGIASVSDVTLEKPDGMIQGLLHVFSILFTLGMLVLGLLIMKVAPARFDAVTGEVKNSPILKAVIGFLAILISIIVLVLTALTIIGLPIVLICGALFFIALVLSTLFVSKACGDYILKLLKKDLKPWHSFVIGFIILNLLFRIPLAGAIILIISISLGFGAIIYALQKNWAGICGNAQ
jgi:hypothetical protein